MCPAKKVIQRILLIERVIKGVFVNQKNGFFVITLVNQVVDEGNFIVHLPGNGLERKNKSNKNKMFHLYSFTGS
jgi:hypothetical protein